MVAETSSQMGDCKFQKNTLLEVLASHCVDIRRIDQKQLSFMERNLSRLHGFRLIVFSLSKPDLL